MSETSQTQARTQAPRWAKRNIGSRFQHRIFYCLIHMGGRRLAYMVLAVVVAWYVLFYRSIREKTRPYLSRRFPGQCHGWPFLWNAYRLCFSYGKVLVDQAVSGILGAEAFEGSFPESEQLQALLAEEKGMILVNSHAGCWQVAMAALPRIDRPVSMLMHRHEADVDSGVFDLSGDRPAYRLIDPSGYLGGALEMMGVLKRKEILCVMGDRLFGKETKAAEAKFLDDRARFPISALKLASACQAPVGILLSHRSGANAYELRLAKVLHLPQGMGKSPEEYQPWVREYVETLEEYVKQYPWQFFNFYDMWDGE